MSKFRPMDSKCPKCEHGLVSAGYWTKGEYRKIGNVLMIDSGSVFFGSDLNIIKIGEE